MSEITPDGVKLRYTVTLRPAQNIDARWVTIGFNDRPMMNEEVYYLGQTYKVTSVRKNF